MTTTMLLLIALFFLLCTALLTAFNSALRRHYDEDSKLSGLGKSFFYQYFHTYIFSKQKIEGLLFATISAQNLARFFYVVFAVFFLIQLKAEDVINTTGFILGLVGLMLLSLVFGDYIPRVLGSRFPMQLITVASPIVSLLLLITLPVTFLWMKFFGLLFRDGYLEHFHEPLTPAKQEILEIIQKAKLSPQLSRHERDIIESVLTFKERIAREVMVPRVDVFSLSADTPIREAAQLIEEEGFSRIPVYRNTVDNIVGVVMYKDLLNKYMEYVEKSNDPNVINTPISSIQKNIIYTPETKKISSLLDEFLRKKVHLAIVVDEYGGTEGIVTIEDILEEIVGEISDEYDEPETLYYPQPDGSWVVDASMSILDVEEELGVKIPKEAEYDSVGGYVFHVAGTIPPRGFVIHQEEFEIEILSSNDRTVTKIRLKPLLKKNSDNNKTESAKEKG